MATYWLSRRCSVSSMRQTVLNKMVRHFAETGGNASTYSDVERLFEGVRSGNRASLARAITLIENTHPSARQRSKVLLELATAHIKQMRPRLEDRAYRVGITGPPGVGKSSFIESFGMFLLDKRLPHNGAFMHFGVDPKSASAKTHAKKTNTSSKAQVTPDGATKPAPIKAKPLECSRLAVLCVDPSSAVTGGSILGDRTRMQHLSQHSNAFIRPSPSGARLGGVARCTAECMILCESAGYDLLMVETVGVGQSECEAINLVDAFVCIVQPGSGDELQAIKRGVIELADIVVVNKFDGDFMKAARRTATAYINALHVIRGRSNTWRPTVVKVSAQTGDGFEQLSVQLRLFQEIAVASGELATRRAEQRVELFRNEMRERVLELVQRNDQLRTRLEELESAVRDERALSGFAADAILNAVLNETNVS